MSTAPDADPVRQPWLHDLLCALAAPTQCWSGADGDIGSRQGARGAEGLYHGDVRILSGVRLELDATAPVPVRTVADGAGRLLSVAVARQLGTATADPTVRVDRRRRVRPAGMHEQLTLRSSAGTEVRTTVRVALACDLAPMSAVKQGHRPSSLEPRHPVDAPGAGTPGAEGGPTWAGEGVSVRVVADGARLALRPDGLELSWDVVLAPGASWSAGWRVSADDPGAVVVAAATAADWARRLSIETSDVRLQRWVRRALQDLSALRMAPAGRVEDVFVAAGAPWFLTLFGRDSLWTARMLLPLGTDLAASTLRALASRQGTVHDPRTAEDPGKIPHELRRNPAQWDEGTTTVTLPPLYYGTVDATSLWILLLHEAWRAGLPDAEVIPLLPILERALAWQEGPGDPDGDGFLEYIDVSGSGLANQGWKDSGDAVQWNAGGLATAPIALAEVQAYAYQAAAGGAELLEHFARPAAGHRAWAGRLRTAFRERFWVGRPGEGGYPAIALDAGKRPVDSLTSNIGHLLGTGLLDATEEAAVAAALASPAMSSGYGLRTLSADAAGFSALSYHGGSIWTHDTAIAVTGLVRGGFDAEAAVLVDGLLAAAESFDYRMPELHSGDARADVPAPMPYPASCRPQAWSAAAAVAVAAACAEASARGGTVLPSTHLVNSRR